MEKIDREKLRELMSLGKVSVIDVLSSQSFLKEHITGSISMPFNELENEGWKKLDRNKIVVPYCAGLNCHASHRAGEILEAAGLKVMVYEGGLEDWKRSGYPMEGASYPSK
ncbi:MAG: rhodanese-like domain-containing protein [Candidatus Thermoplasmatota archaeon]|jgi:rhodanese-related sulfurtransferase|nr:rhodanese-like domain-containing protein [Candidatus Thermoplasmatota archaeon]